MLFISFPADTGFVYFAAAFAVLFPAGLTAGLPVLFAAFPAAVLFSVVLVKAPADAGFVYLGIAAAGFSAVFFPFCA